MKSKDGLVPTKEGSTVSLRSGRSHSGELAGGNSRFGNVESGNESSRSSVGGKIRVGPDAAVQDTSGVHSRKGAEKENDPRTRTLSRENLPRLERTGSTNDTTVESGTMRLGNMDRSRDQPSRLSGKVNPGEISEDNNYRLPPSRLSMYSTTDDGTKPPTGDRGKPSRVILGRRPGRESITPRDSDSNLENGVSDRSVKPGEHSTEGSRRDRPKPIPRKIESPSKSQQATPRYSDDGLYLETPRIRNAMWAGAHGAGTPRTDQPKAETALMSACADGNEYQIRKLLEHSKKVSFFEILAT